MGKKLTKFLNIITFGHLNRKAKKEALRQEKEKNKQLTLNTMALPDINALVSALDGITNVESISTTISTITFKINKIDNVNFELLRKMFKGVIKSPTSITLLVGDCANSIKDEILKLKQ